jgi:hypothetical protein
VLIEDRADRRRADRRRADRESEARALRVEDLYRPPAEEPAVAVAASPFASRFYVVAAPKFLLLALVTTSQYNLYWFFTNWRRHGEATDQRTLPLLRALLPIFFVHRLFGLIAPARSSAYSWHPGEMATLYVICAVGSRLLHHLGPYVATRLGATAVIPWLEHGSTLLGLCQLYPIFSAQRAANAAAGDPQGSSNSRLNAINYIFLALGVVGWLLYFNILTPFG